MRHGNSRRQQQGRDCTRGDWPGAWRRRWEPGRETGASGWRRCRRQGGAGSIRRRHEMPEIVEQLKFMNDMLTIIAVVMILMLVFKKMG